jgi:lipopolysaccharide/colanic/teichoic acid biosynthesis glycosyltransferase
MNEGLAAYSPARYPGKSTTSQAPLPAYANGYLKRGLDFLVSLLGLLLGSPLLIWVAIRVRWSSPGPVIYAQERIGRNGKPFTIYKFRSMRADAEKQGPQLSSPTDPRITPWGRTMRRYRIDELPQLWNVLKGEMSLVGPRPERAYFIRRILPAHPEYARLLDVKPGLTGKGMVEFGYAENTGEMARRMHHDLAYLREASLAEDLRIGWQTLRIILTGTGK